MATTRRDIATTCSALPTAVAKLQQALSSLDSARFRVCVDEALHAAVMAQAAERLALQTNVAQRPTAQHASALGAAASVLVNAAQRVCDAVARTLLTLDSAQSLDAAQRMLLLHACEACATTGARGCAAIRDVYIHVSDIASEIGAFAAARARTAGERRLVATLDATLRPFVICQDALVTAAADAGGVQQRLLHLCTRVRDLRRHAHDAVHDAGDTSQHAQGAVHKAQGAAKTMPTSSAPSPLVPSRAPSPPPGVSVKAQLPDADGVAVYSAALAVSPPVMHNEVRTSARVDAVAARVFADEVAPSASASAPSSIPSSVHSSPSGPSSSTAARRSIALTPPPSQPRSSAADVRASVHRAVAAFNASMVDLRDDASSAGGHTPAARALASVPDASTSSSDVRERSDPSVGITYDDGAAPITVDAAHDSAPTALDRRNMFMSRSADARQSIGAESGFSHASTASDIDEASMYILADLARVTHSTTTVEPTLGHDDSQRSIAATATAATADTQFAVEEQPVAVAVRRTVADTSASSDVLASVPDPVLAPALPPSQNDADMRSHLPLTLPDAASIEIAPVPQSVAAGKPSAPAAVVTHDVAAAPVDAAKPERLLVTASNTSDDLSAPPRIDAPVPKLMSPPPLPVRKSSRALLATSPSAASAAQGSAARAPVRDDSTPTQAPGQPFSASVAPALDPSSSTEATVVRTDVSIAAATVADDRERESRTASSADLAAERGTAAPEQQPPRRKNSRQPSLSYFDMDIPTAAAAATAALAPPLPASPAHPAAQQPSPRDSSDGSGAIIQGGPRAESDISIQSDWSMGSGALRRRPATSSFDGPSSPALAPHVAFARIQMVNQAQSRRLPPHLRGRSADVRPHPAATSAFDQHGTQRLHDDVLDLGAPAVHVGINLTHDESGSDRGLDSIEIDGQYSFAAAAAVAAAPGQAPLPAAADGSTTSTPPTPSRPDSASRRVRFAAGTRGASKEGREEVRVAPAAVAPESNSAPAVARSEPPTASAPVIAEVHPEAAMPVWPQPVPVDVHRLPPHLRAAARRTGLAVDAVPAAPPPAQEPEFRRLGVNGMMAMKRLMATAVVPPPTAVYAYPSSPRGGSQRNLLRR